MLVQPPIRFVFEEFCKFWNTWFWHDVPSLVPDVTLALSLRNWCFDVVAKDDNDCDAGLLWYNSGVGGVVLMYQPHWGDISDPFEPSLFSDGYLPYGLVGIINPLPAVRGFMFGMYLAVSAVFLSWSDSPWDTSCRIDLDFRMADLVGLWALAVTDEYGWLVWSWCDILCSFPMVKFVSQNTTSKKKKR
jgi:hypothetical protein